MVSFQKDSHLLRSFGMFGVGYFLLVFPHFLAALKVVVGCRGWTRSFTELRLLATADDLGGVPRQ